MKIAFLSIRDWDIGGVTHYIINLYYTLIKKGITAKIYVLNASGKPLKAYYKGCKVVYLKCKNFEENAEILNKYDIIHLTDMGKYEDRKLEEPKYWETIKRLKRNKLLGTWHCSPDYTVKKYFPFGRQLERNYCQLCYCIRKHPNYIQMSHLIDGKFIYNEKDKKNLVISTARVTSSKGQMFLLKAVPFIKGMVEIYSWCRNRYTYDMQNMKEFKSRNLKVFPEYEYKDVPKIIKHAKVLLNLSYYDGKENGTEYCILEAMKYGAVPIVDESWCTTNLKQGELKNGLNVIGVNRKDPEGMAKYINLILSNDEMRKIIIKANIEFLKRYDRNIVVDKYIKFYKWFLNGRKKRSKLC